MGNENIGESLSPIYFGLDLSDKTDLTALVAVQDGTIHIFFEHEKTIFKNINGVPVECKASPLIKGKNPFIKLKKDRDHDK